MKGRMKMEKFEYKGTYQPQGTGDMKCNRCSLFYSGGFIYVNLERICPKCFESAARET